LFARLDKDDILRCYRLFFEIFYDNEKAGYSTAEMVKRDRDFYREVGRLIDDVVNVRDIAPTGKNLVIFVQQCVSEFIDKADRKVFSACAFREDAFREKAGKDFQVCSDGKEALCPYAYDRETLEVIGNYRVADQSIKKLSAVVCAATILDDITWFGYDEKTRMKNIKEENDLLKKLVGKVRGEDVSCSDDDDDASEDDDRDCAPPQECKDKDRRRYNELKLRFYKDVEDIEFRWLRKADKRNHRGLVNLIKSEWRRMYGGKKG